MAAEHLIFGMFVCWFQLVQTSQPTVFFSYSKSTPISSNQPANKPFTYTVVFELSWTCEVITEATVLGVLLACISREKLTVLFIWRGKVELLQETCGLELPTVAIRASDVAAFAAYFHRVGDHAKIHRGQHDRLGPVR